MIKSELNNTFNIESERLEGYTSETNGGYRVVSRPGQIRSKALLVGIPENKATLAADASFRNFIRQMVAEYKTSIKVVPVKGWKE